MLKRKQQGAGIMEALVAILILSIGLLGMLGMQTASLKFEQSNWIRSALSVNISNLADRIRANAAADAGAYTHVATYAAERAAIEASSTYFTPTKNCDTTACSAAELAAYDLLIWQRDLDLQLPGATGFVATTGAKGVDLRYAITVAWFDKDNTDSGGALQSPNICPAATTTGAAPSTGVAGRNCCPSAVGTAAALAGVRCVNLEIIP
jgi:type IV pilus assembly protein PilV